jgi:EF hand
MNKAWDFILDRSPEELIGAGLVVFLLSLAASGIHALGRRKLNDNFMLTLGVIFLASIASLVLVVGFAVHAPTATGVPPYTFEKPPSGGFGPGMSLGPQILRAADADKDGRLSPKEASEAAERFVREADSAKTGSIDVGALSGAINRRPFPPPEFRPGPPNRFLAARLVERADADKDGHLSPEEAALFVRKADGDGKGYADTRDIDAALSDRVGPAPPVGDPTPP